MRLSELRVRLLAGVGHCLAVLDSCGEKPGLATAANEKAAFSRAGLCEGAKA